MDVNRIPTLWFGEENYIIVGKIESTCKVKEVVEYLEEKLSDREIRWFKEHPQFCHMFHMPMEGNRKQMGLWLLLHRTAKTLMRDECWFVVNGVPIRYSIREHALITELSCHPLPDNYEVDSGSAEFIARWFEKKEPVNIINVRSRLDGMEEVDGNDDRLKMAVLYFLGTILSGKKNDSTRIDEFLTKVVENLHLCTSFPWGSYTFFNCVKTIRHIVEKSKGIAKKSYTFPGFILALERLAFESISNLKEAFLEEVIGADGACTRMCKTSFVKNYLKGYTLEEIYKKLGKTKEIQSILECKQVEEPLLANIVENTNAYVDLKVTWKEDLRENRRVCWEDLYHKDLYHRKIKRQALKSSLTGYPWGLRLLGRSLN